MWLAVVGDLAIVALLSLAVCVPVGRWICGRCLTDMPVGRSAPVAFVLGAGMWGFGVLALGLTHFLSAPIVAVIGAAAAAVALLFRPPEVARDKPGEFRPPMQLAFDAALIILSASCIAIAGLSALAPETAFDALNVHLPYARDAAQSGGIGFMPNNWSSVMPALPLTTYVTGFLFSGVRLVKLLNVLWFLAGGGIVYGFARRWWGRTHGFAAAVLYWSCPVVLYEATTALIDLPLAAYSAVALLSLMEWTRTDKTGPLWVSAIALGLAFGCKYHAAFWVLPVVVIIAWQTLVIRRQTLRHCAALVLRYGTIVSLLFLPWAVRAWWYTGNPVFPLANGVFQSPYFPESMDTAARAAYANEGVGHSPAALLRLPWTVTFHPGPFRGTLGILFLPGIFLALFRNGGPQKRYLLIACALFFYSWAVTAQEIRYLIPMVPLLAVLTVIGLLGGDPEIVSNAFAPRSKPGRRRFRVWSGAAATLIAGIMAWPWLYPLWAREWTYWHGYQSPLPFLAGHQTAQDYLKRDVPSIYVYGYVNQNLSPRDRILLLNDASQFYSEVPTLYSFTVEGEALLLQRTEEGILRKLRESRITHVLLNYNGIEPIKGVAPRLGVYFFLDKAFQERHLEPVYSRNNVVLYRFRSR